MEYRGGQQTKIVVASTPEEFEARLNKTLQELAKKGARPKIEFNMSMGFCAYILYDRTYAIPETLEDEFELAGEVHRCRECKFYHPPTDGRTKRSRCLVGQRIVKEDSTCCEDFYKALLDGKIEVKEDSI